MDAERSPNSLACLTPQLFQPKLRHTIKMYATSYSSRVYALLLGIIFLIALFHFCDDLNAGPSGPHPCPYCSTADSVIATPTLDLGVDPVVNRLEVFVKIPSPSLEVLRSTSTRAPPAL